MRFFLIYLFLEIAVSIPAFSYLGVFGTFIEILASAFVGFFILANAQSSFAQSFSYIQQRNLSMQAFQTMNIMSLLGAFLLIIPGVMTDIFGVLMQFGLISSFASSYFVKQDEQKSGVDGDIIDVEVIEQNDRGKNG